MAGQDEFSQFSEDEVVIATAEVHFRIVSHLQNSDVRKLKFVKLVRDDVLAQKRT